MSLADAASARLLRLEQPDAAGDLENGGLHAYWRKPDGDIVISGMGPHEVQGAIESGFQLLMPYGKFALIPSRKGSWEPNNDPYYLILSLGGIRDFTLKQIMEHRWHLRPHAVLAKELKELTDRGLDPREALDTVIPQMRGVEFEAEFCTYCPDKIFNNKRQLEKHEIVHKAEKGQRQLSETIGDALAKAQNGNVEALAPILEKLATSQDALTLLMAKLLEEKAAPAPAQAEVEPITEADVAPSSRKNK